MRTTETTEGDRTTIRHELDPEDFGLKRGPTIGGTMTQYQFDALAEAELTRFMREENPTIEEIMAKCVLLERETKEREV